MIKYSNIEDIFAQDNISINEYNIETLEEISLPYLVYTVTDGDTFSADGINYIRLLNLSLALFDETLNFSMQRRIEQVLDRNFTSYDKQINFDENARLYSITYTFEVLDE